VVYNINVNGSVIDGRTIAPAVHAGLVELHGTRNLPGFMRPTGTGSAVWAYTAVPA
jgi:hypothetical protein